MKRGRVLIVDDQEEILDSLGAVLMDEGHEVICARDGQEALHVVQSDSPDVVFLDIWIPGIDGMQTLKAIKRVDPRCSVVMMSGHGTIETAVKAIKLGAADYLEKPLNLEDVLHLVDKAVSCRSSSKKAHEADYASPGVFIGKSDRAVMLRKSLARAMDDSGTIWLSGEKGTGKEFIARVLHHMEGKDRTSLKKIRCKDLTVDNIGDILLAKNSLLQRREKNVSEPLVGTLLLVRIDRLEQSLRGRLNDLIVALSKDYAAAGFNGKSGVRIVSTSQKDPDTLVADDEFPETLAAFLGHRVIRLPNLRQRSEDIPLLINHFLKEAGAEFDRNLVGADEDALVRLCEYSWPGNVKELKILIEHVVMTAPGPMITLNDLLIPGGKGEEYEGEPSGLSDEFTMNVIAESSDRPILATVEDQCQTNPSVKGPVQDRAVLMQKTLRGRVVVYGQGLHSGVKTGLTLSPMPPSSGIVFGHITSGGTVPALLYNVESTGFSTSLKRNGSLARTIEHLMAVFHVYGLTNVLVKISGEVPIMDGSALDFCNLVESAEIITQDEPIEPIRMHETIELETDPDSPKRIRIEPSDCLEIEYHLDYPQPVGTMHMVFRCESPEAFKEQIAPARTFGFLKDMRMMDEMGLAGGGRLSNVVLLDEEKVINPPLRFPDEFVRHKILDIIGDFYLLGRPFVGRIVAKLTGHTENIAMLKVIDQKLKIL
ncbi:MAG: UDP-3-O-acyl-N-acetylglucosamine deacetylase [Deltaproteobacteria bacterium]|jgi:UDP-3-O-acyl N-acetylglucosamine deacetylase|nr:UDP-3-O-acyl-N-acetylglucosamine deacetylase [Deltaproteobacteria bacterium]